MPHAVRRDEAEYWDFVAGKRIDNIWKRQAVTRRLLRQDLIGKNVLEIGAGLASAFAGIDIVLAGNLHYLAMDVSAEWVKFITETWGLPAFQADIRKLPVKDGTIDLIVGLDSFEHIRPEDRATGWKEINRALKPDGRVVLNFSLMESLHDPKYDHGWTPADTEDLAKAARLNLASREVYTIQGKSGSTLTYEWLELTR